MRVNSFSALLRVHQLWVLLRYDHRTLCDDRRIFAQCADFDDMLSIGERARVMLSECGWERVLRFPQYRRQCWHVTAAVIGSSPPAEVGTNGQQA